MNKKFVSIFPNNINYFLQNSMFAIKKSRGIEFPVFSHLKELLSKENVYINTYDMTQKKPIFRNIHIDIPFPFPANFFVWKTIFLDRKKNILICMEPPTVNPFSYLKIIHSFFIKVYTWNDDLVDNERSSSASKKYFKINLPKSILGINTKVKRFKDKKFLTLINSNKISFYPFKLFCPFGKELYSERIKAIEFFGRRIPDKFYLYGFGWNKLKRYNLKEFFFGYKKYSTYKGSVNDKIKILSNFKYCLCFENLTDVNGYITEKIFDCFMAKCVPIYWGASNIEKYIPKDCFIDFRDFNNYEKLLTFLNSIDENRYNRYIENIQKLLDNKKFIALWFENGFSKFFLENILDIKRKK